MPTSAEHPTVSLSGSVSRAVARPTHPPARARSEDAWLELDGLRYRHRILRHPQPTFEPTLFVSGAFQTMDSWARFARAFASRTTVVLCDPPGMGDSDPLPPEVGVDVLADCLHRVVEAHGLGRVNVVSASYGTPSAFRLAQCHPNRVRRVVLAGTMRCIPEAVRRIVLASVESARRGDRPRLAAQAVEALLCADADRPVERRALAERILRSIIARMSDRELRNYVANSMRLLEHPPLDVEQRVQGPEALVFTGEHDAFTPPALGRQVAGAFERAWHTTIRRADHLFHVERFDAVVELLLAFMQGELPRPIPGCGPVERVGPRLQPAAGAGA